MYIYFVGHTLLNPVGAEYSVCLAFLNSLAVSCEWAPGGSYISTARLYTQFDFQTTAAFFYLIELPSKILDPHPPFSTHMPPTKKQTFIHGTLPFF